MKFFFVFGKSLPIFPEWLRAQSFFQCRAQAQSFFLCTELSVVHRAFRCAQSFVLAAFATLVCQRNCGFSLQRHKTAKSWAFCGSLPVFCGSELFLSMGWRTTRELDFSHSYEHSFISIYQGWEPGEAAFFCPILPLFKVLPLKKLFKIF